MKRLNVSIILFLIIAAPTLAQRGFVIKSDTAFYNSEMKDQGAIKNGLSCIMGKRNDAQIEYTPYEVIQYGTADKVYQAQTINLNGKKQRVFLERLAHGKLSLYAFKAKDSKPVYFIANEDTLALNRINSDRNAFSTLFNSRVSDCGQAVENVKYVNYKRGSLTRFIRDYNVCSANPLPRLRYGFIIGLSNTKILAGDVGGVFQISEFKNDIAFTVGGFLDKPIGAGNFSFHPEILWRQNSATYQFKNPTSDYDFVVNNSILSMPLLMQYVLPGNRNHFFLQAGGVVAHLLKNKNSLYQFTSLANTTSLEIDDSVLVPTNQVGLALGAGFRADRNERSWLMEIRYSHMVGMNQHNDYLDSRGIEILTGFAF